MEIVMAIVICGLFGLWVWNLKSDLNDLQKRLDDESSRIVLVYGPSKPRPVRAPAPIKDRARGVFHEGDKTWTIN
jgi:hypothetical protein